MAQPQKKAVKKDDPIIPRLSPSRIKGAEFTRNVHVVRVEQSVKMDDLLDSLFWTHVAVKLKAGDHIEVVPDDSSYYAELYVIAASKTSARVALINHVEFSENGRDVAEMSNTDHPDYDIRWGGAVEKFQVVYKPDAKVIHSGSETKLDAAKWIEDYVKSLTK